MSLERVERFLAKLGNPHLNLPPVVHVAGTNGKGSTISMLKSMLEASGASVHVMTSPHLVHVTERIVISGNHISSEELIDLLEECLAVNSDEPITFFEMMTAATYLAFSRTDADYCLLETGMGGRLDATNVVPNPVCTIITTISMDHEKFLGNSLPEIAREKAGIMKAGVPCVVGYQTPEAISQGIENVIQTQSQGLSPASPLLQFGAEWSVEPKNDEAVFRFEDDSYRLQKPNLEGTHQIYNMGAALVAYRVITNAPIDPKVLSPALAKTQWRARLQTLETGTLRDILPKDATLIIDGAHNDSAGSFLAQQMQIWQQQDLRAGLEKPQPLHLIVAMVNRKNPKMFLEPIKDYVDSITICEIEGEATSFSVDELYDLVKPLNFKQVYKAISMEKALENLSEQCLEGKFRVLMTGSLYFMGNILSR